MLPSQLKEFSQSLVAVSLFASNFLFWQKDDYFAPAAEENPLLHTWSLAVEEQFYIFFPLLLVLTWRFGRKYALLSVILLSMASLMSSEYGWRHHASANFYLLHSRLWELGMGGLCAFYLSNRQVNGNQGLSLLGLIMILVSVFLYDESIPFPSLYASLPVIGTALIVLYAREGTFSARFLSNRLFVGIGLISFSAYLWHQPIFAFSRIRILTEPGAALMAGLSVLSLLVGYVSWKYVEQPFRSAKQGVVKKRSTVFISSFVGGAAFLALGLYGIAEEGFASRIAISDDIYKDLNVRELKNECFDIEQNSLSKAGSFCLLGNQEVKPDLALLGDSHSLSFAGPFDSLLKEEGRAMLYSGVAGCPPILDRYVLRDDYRRTLCNSRNQNVYKDLVDKGIKRVILVSRWTYYTTGDVSGGFVYVGDHYDVEKSRDRSKASVLSGLRETLDFLSKYGVEVVLVHQPPVQKVNARDFYRWAALFGGEDFSVLAEKIFLDRDFHEQQYSALREEINAIAHGYPAAITVNFEDLLCLENVCRIGTSERSFYYDEDHLSNYGARMVIKKIIGRL